MATQLRFKVRRGPKAHLPDLEEGEVGFATDSRELFIGTDTATNVSISTSSEVDTKLAAHTTESGAHDISVVTGAVSSATAQAMADAAQATAALDAQARVNAHANRQDNPHTVTLAQVGGAPAVHVNAALGTGVHPMPTAADVGAATAGHNHTGVYEPTLGNPSSDGQTLVSSAAGGRSWFTTPGGGYRKLLIANNGVTPDSKMDITADMVTLYDASNNAKPFFGVSLSGIDVGASGANGLDTGSKANSTSYHLWLIGKEDSTLAGLWSLSATAPTMPAGYTYKWRCHGNHTDSSGYIYRVRQANNLAVYVPTPATNTATIPVLAAGAAARYTAVAVSPHIPTTGLVILGVLGVAGNSTAAEVAPNSNYASFSGFQTIAVSWNNGYAGTVNVPFRMLLESGNIYYYSNAASAKLSCYGWEDNI